MAGKSLVRAALLGTAAALWLLPATAGAGGFTIIELGDQKTGMMTGIAKPDDLSAVYHNPAGLADLHGTRLHLSAGFSFVDASVRLKAWEGSESYISTPVDADGYFQGTVHPTRYFGAMPMFVASSDFGWKDGPVVAFSVYVPDFIGAFLPDDAPTRYMVTEAYFIAGVTSVSAGYRLPKPLDLLCLGASIGAMYVRQEGKKWINPVGVANYEYIIHVAGEDWEPFWNVGLTVDALPQLAFGVSFIGAAHVSMKGRFDIDLAPTTTQDLFKSDGGLAGHYRLKRMTTEVPPGLNLGVNWIVIPQLTLAADFRYWFYNVYKEQVVETDLFDVKPAFKTSVVKPEMFNTPKNYEDSWTISLGGLTRPFGSFPIELMAGWTYDHSPAPSTTTSLDSPTVNLTGFSLGARYTLAEMWRLSLTYYRYWYLHQTVTDSTLNPPQNSQFEGSVDTVSVELEVTF